MEAFYVQSTSRTVTYADRLKSLEDLWKVMGKQTLSSLVAGRFLSLFSRQDIVEQLNVRFLKLHTFRLDQDCLTPYFSHSVRVLVSFEMCELCAVVTQDAVARCYRRAATDGLTVELNHSIRGLYERFACDLYAKAARGCNLQSLYAMYSHPPADKRLLHEFTRAALEGLCPTTLASVQVKYIHGNVMSPVSSACMQSSAVFAFNIVFLHLSQDRMDTRIPDIPCAEWLWSPLPFMHHINEASKNELVAILSTSSDDAGSSDRLR